MAGKCSKKHRVKNVHNELLDESVFFITKLPEGLGNRDPDGNQ